MGSRRKSENTDDDGDGRIEKRLVGRRPDGTYDKRQRPKTPTKQGG